MAKPGDNEVEELAIEGPESSDFEPPARTVAHHPQLPWALFATAICGYLSVKWTMAAIPASSGEALALRWLRAFSEHPVRSPLGLVLAWIGLRALLRAALNRPARS